MATEPTRESKRSKELTRRLAPPGTRRNGPLDVLLETTGRVLGPVARTGWRGARGLGRRLGVDRVVQRAFDRGVDRALESEAVERTAVRVLDSEMVDRVWRHILESEEAQQLVERVAEAPEVRSAIAAQGVGLLEDLRRGVRRFTRRLDTEAERVVRTLFGRPIRAERPIYAGAITRLMALTLDAGAVYGGLLLVSAAIALLVSSLTSDDINAGAVVITLGALAWALIAATYLVVFWSGTGRTPGMSFLGLRMVSADGEGVSPRQAIRRVIWLALSALPLLLGFSGVLLEERRRGWPDRRAGTVVLYVDPILDRP